jgi:hypothetical protein
MMPKPLPKPFRNLRRHTEEKLVTVCISAICEKGNAIVSATDGAISYGISADVNTYKMRVLKDWLFQFSGTFSNADLIMEEIERELKKDSAASSNSKVKIQELLQNAYRRRFSQWISDRNLAVYDLSVEEFKREGLKIFGSDIFSELTHALAQDSERFNESMLVSGFPDDHPLAVLYEINREGKFSHSTTGIAAIGSGGVVAMTTLLLLGCSRYMPLEFTLYAVAAAKFSAENCDGVGRSTNIVITRNPRVVSGKEKYVIVIQPKEIDVLRNLWEKYGRPKIPIQGLDKLNSIACEAGTSNDLVGLKGFLKLMQSVPQKSEGWL